MEKGMSLGQYYTRVQESLINAGLLRQERDVKNAPSTPHRLARDFAEIALRSEYGGSLGASGPDSRKPVLAWPREVPIEGKPADVVEDVRLNGEWLLSSQIPKLMFYAEPGALMPRPVADYLTANVPNIEARFVGAGSHFLQEDQPHVIGQGIADWLRRI